MTPPQRAPDLTNASGLGVNRTGIASGPVMKFDARHGNASSVGELEVGQAAQDLGEHHLQLQTGE